jgi:DNA-binding transcriptional ArsR family regulator
VKHNIVAPVGDQLDSTYAGVREFPTEKIFLLSTGKHREKSEELKALVEKLGIAVQTVEIKGHVFEGMIRALGQIRSSVPEDSILVNVSSGENMENCAALSAAYVNGVKAFAVMNGEVKMLPVLKFSYYKLIPERKMAILRFLKTQPDCCSSLEELSRRTGMSLPLVSYHVNGNARAQGLVTEGLVETHQGPGGKTQVMLTELGRLLEEGDLEPFPGAARKA